jgi:predicted transposase YbfD/YdcC
LLVGWKRQLAILLRKVFAVNATTLSVTPFGSERTFTLCIADVYTQFEQIRDQRKRRGVRYPLAMLLTIALLAKLAGASQVRAIAEWARERAEELAALFDVQRPSMPHPTTWSRVLANALAVEALERALAPLLAPPATAEEPARASRPIALDGKTLRGTIPTGHTSGVHLLSAYQVDSGVALAQVALASKENEIVAAPRLLKGLNLRGAIISGDAMFSQRALSTQVVEAGGDYCWIVKQNQARLYDDLKLLFSPVVVPVAKGWSSIPLDFRIAEQVDKRGGRIELRRLTASSLLCEYENWPYLAQAFQVVRIVYQGRNVNREERYGITSVPAANCSPYQLLQVVRGHWRIENSLHYRRDVTLHEDASQVRMGHAPQVLATLNNAVCGLLARAGLTNLAALQRSLAAAFDRLLFQS